MIDREVVCLTPVRNEAWIIEAFLQQASRWADRVILADQGSTDDTREIAAKFPKVEVIHNQSAFDEFSRQTLLIEHARKTAQSPQVMVALDADEFLSENLIRSEDWQRILNAPPGSAYSLSRVDLYQGSSQFFVDSGSDLGLWQKVLRVDDGVDHCGGHIHSPRLPPSQSVTRLVEPRLLHAQFVDIDRMSSKHRWYRCHERLKFPEKSDAEINRLYGWMHRHDVNLRSIQPAWISDDLSVQLRDLSTRSKEFYWWDWEVLGLLDKHGVGLFSGLDIWDFDWESLHRIAISEARGEYSRRIVRSPARHPWADFFQSVVRRFRK